MQTHHLRRTSRTLLIGFRALAFGYAVLRAQLRTLNSSMGRAITWSLGLISIVVLATLVDIASLVVRNQAASLLGVALALTVLSPPTWQLARGITRRLFMEQVLAGAGDTRGSVHLAPIASELVQSFVVHFGADACALLVLEEDTGYFQCVSSAPDALAGRVLLAQLLSSGRQVDDRGGERLWIEWMPQVAARLKSAKQPVFLRDVQEEHAVSALSSDSSRSDLLCVPICLREQLIAVLVSGACQHGEWSDFHLIADFIRRSGFASRLQTARIAAQTDQHKQMLQNLYRSSSLLDVARQTLVEGATTLALVVSETVLARAEIWLCRQENGSVIERLAVHGVGPASIHGSTLQLSAVDWIPAFYEPQQARASAGELPACFRAALPSFPLAWLPLSFSQHIGVLIITFPRLHTFAEEERSVLITFAAHCAVALETLQTVRRTRLSLEHYQATMTQQQQLTQQVVQALADLVQQERSAPAYKRVRQWRNLGVLTESFRLLQHMDAAASLTLQTLDLGTIWQEALAMLSDDSRLIEEHWTSATYVLAHRKALKLVVACQLLLCSNGEKICSRIEKGEQLLVMHVSGQMSGQRASESDNQQKQAVHALCSLLCQGLVEAMNGRFSSEVEGNLLHTVVTLKRGSDALSVQE